MRHFIEFNKTQAIAKLRAVGYQDDAINQIFALGESHRTAIKLLVAIEIFKDHKEFKEVRALLLTYALEGKLSLDRFKSCSKALLAYGASPLNIILRAHKGRGGIVLNAIQAYKAALEELGFNFNEIFEIGDFEFGDKNLERLINTYPVLSKTYPKEKILELAAHYDGFKRLDDLLHLAQLKRSAENLESASSSHQHKKQRSNAEAASTTDEDTDPDEPIAPIQKMPPKNIVGSLTEETLAQILNHRKNWEAAEVREALIENYQKLSSVMDDSQIIQLFEGTFEFDFSEKFSSKNLTLTQLVELAQTKNTFSLFLALFSSYQQLSFENLSDEQKCKLIFLSKKYFLFEYAALLRETLTISEIIEGFLCAKDHDGLVSWLASNVHFLYSAEFREGKENQIRAWYEQMQISFKACWPTFKEKTFKILGTCRGMTTLFHLKNYYDQLLAASVPEDNFEDKFFELATRKNGWLHLKALKLEKCKNLLTGVLNEAELSKLDKIEDSQLTIALVNACCVVIQKGFPKELIFDLMKHHSGLSHMNTLIELNIFSLVHDHYCNWSQIRDILLSSNGADGKQKLIEFKQKIQDEINELHLAATFPTLREKMLALIRTHREQSVSASGNETQAQVSPVREVSPLTLNAGSSAFFAVPSPRAQMLSPEPIEENIGPGCS